LSTLFALEEAAFAFAGACFFSPLGFSAFGFCAFAERSFFSAAGFSAFFGASAFSPWPGLSALSALQPSRPSVADRHDPQDRVLLAMALLAAIVVPAALLEDGDLVALRLGDDLGRDGQAVGRLQVRAVAGEQDVAQGDGVTGVCRRASRRSCSPIRAGSTPRSS
jgi:hypothetical protein